MTIIRAITYKDLDDLVSVHNSAFQGFFLTELGFSFLKLYYRSVLKSKQGILLGAYKDGILVGFCAASRKSAGFNKALIKSNSFQFGLICSKLLLTKPKAILRLAKNLTKTGDNRDFGEYAELMSIGVVKTVQNSGAGKLLLAELESILKREGILRLSLTTDFEGNENTLAFYSKRGFKEMYTFETYPQRKMYRLIKDLNN